MGDSKLNHSQIESYAKEFAALSSANFFKSQDQITGQEILKFSPVKQVNFMILKNLFEQWQEETKKLKSPYFNFKSEKVIKALMSFMNELSQNIEVGRDDFQQLLVSATQDSLYLSLAPFDYLWADLANTSENLAIKNIKAKGKYIKANKHIFSAFLEGVEALGTPKVEKDQAMSVLEKLIEEGELQAEDPMAIIEEFNSVLDLDVTTLYEQEPSEEVSETVEEEDDESNLLSELFDEDTLLDESPEPESTSLPEVPPEPSIEVSPSDEIESATNSDELSEDSVDQDTTIPGPAPQKRVLRKRRPIQPMGEETSQEDSSVNTRFSNDQKIVHDQLQDKEQVTIADIHESQPVGEMHQSISVNQRYMFIKELFNNDSDNYTKAINDIERCESFDDSVELMIQRYAKKLDWDMNSPEVKELLKVIFKKFR